MRASGVRPRFCGLGRAHHDERRGAVIDAGGVGRRHGAVLGEGRAQLGDALERHAMLDVFVGVDDDVALLGRDGVGDDLVLELAGLLRGLGLVLRLRPRIRPAARG